MSAFVQYVCRRFSLAIVAVGGVFMLLMFLSVSSNTPHIGTFGIYFRNARNEIALQFPNGELKSGDRLDLASLTPEQRFSMVGTAPAGATMTLHAYRPDGTDYTTVVTARRSVEYSEAAQLAQSIGIPICFFLSLGLASVLLLMRPQPVTLAFYGYTILMLIKVYQTSLDLASWPMNFLCELAMQIVYPLTQLSILFFAARLHGDPGPAWRYIRGAALVAAAGALVVWAGPELWITTQRFGLIGPATQFFKGVIDVVLLVVTLCGLAYVASASEGAARRRIAWIVGGIAMAPILDLIWAVADVATTIVGGNSAVLVQVEGWTDALMPWAGLCGIVAVLYGFLSQRVVDFRVAISRAALYAGTTLVIVVFFGAVEWLAEQIFESTKPAMYVSLIAALSIGFAMRAVHGKLEAAVDAIFFKEAHRAQAALRRAARAVANATTEKTVIEFLVDEPVAVLDLTSAALFLARTDDAPFECVDQHGWSGEHAASFGQDDVLPVMLRAELGPIVLDARRRAELLLPGSERLEAIVVPIVMRGRVFGFAFYGERRDGATFSSEERDLLATIAHNAGSAFDHIDAERSRRRIAELEARLAALGTPAAS